MARGRLPAEIPRPALSRRGASAVSRLADRGIARKLAAKASLAESQPTPDGIDRDLRHGRDLFGRVSQYEIEHHGFAKDRRKMVQKPPHFLAPARGFDLNEGRRVRVGSGGLAHRIVGDDPPLLGLLAPPRGPCRKHGNTTRELGDGAFAAETGERIEQAEGGFLRHVVDVAVPRTQHRPDGTANGSGDREEKGADGVRFVTTDRGGESRELVTGGVRRAGCGPWGLLNQREHARKCAKSAVRSRSRASRANRVQQSPSATCLFLKWRA